MTISLKYISVTIATPLLYASVIFGGLIGWLIWDERISLSFIIGMMIVILGASLVVYFTSKADKKVSKQQI